MGWRNDTLGMAGKPVEIIFEFDSIRNFSAIILHTNNMFTKDVQVIYGLYENIRYLSLTEFVF